MFEQLAETSGLKATLAQHLEDSVNWVEFIRTSNLTKEEQRFWRDHFNLPHV
ncbi:hypothetical protein [Vibrio sp. TRT 1302]|uniref:hypothetical protein n=1 Tax=Vibrio sp. TRT 1302 TaxID=3418504 RepID=UPI003CF8A3C3